VGLPRNQRVTQAVPIGDVTIDIRGLDLFQIRELAKMDQDASDAQAIAWATGCTLEEADEWIRESGGGDAVELLAAIMKASGWDRATGAQFPA